MGIIIGELERTIVINGTELGTDLKSFLCHHVAFLESYKKSLKFSVVVVFAFSKS